MAFRQGAGQRCVGSNGPVREVAKGYEVLGSDFEAALCAGHEEVVSQKLRVGSVYAQDRRSHPWRQLP